MKNKKHLAQIQKSTAEETPPANSQKKKAASAIRCKKAAGEKVMKRLYSTFVHFEQFVHIFTPIA